MLCFSCGRGLVVCRFQSCVLGQPGTHDMGVAVTAAVFLFPPCASGVVSHRFIAVHCLYKVFNLSILCFYLVAEFFYGIC